MGQCATKTQKEISYDKQLLTNITSTFDGQCKGSIPKTFLSIGSHLKDIPKGVKGHKQSGAVYHRCIQFQKKAFTTDTFVSLVEGTCIVYILLVCIIMCVMFIY